MLVEIMKDLIYSEEIFYQLDPERARFPMILEYSFRLNSLLDLLAIGFKLTCDG